MAPDFFIDPIILFGFLIIAGIGLSFIFQKVGVPHIVVYILVGFILSNTLYSDFGLVEEFEDLFLIVEHLALGLIGFKIGTELKLKQMIKQVKTLSVILIGNAGGAMLIVTILVFLFTPSFNLKQRIIMSLILGGVATATAPAATVEIIRKYKSKGALTTLILAILALDDVGAVIIVEVILVFVTVSLGSGFELSEFFMGLFQELGLALILGIVIGLALDFIVERMHDDLEMMEWTFGVLIFTVGVTHFVHTSVILTTMVIGITTTNLKGDNYERAGDLLEVIMSPIVTLFFVLVGAKVALSDFNPFPILAVVYFIARLIGKYYGSYAGAALVGSSPEIRQNLGLGMFAQGGVALGLASVISETLLEGGETEMAGLVVSVIVIATVFSETLGTVTARYGLTRAGEIVADPEDYPSVPGITPVQPVLDDDHWRTVHSRD